MKTIEKLITVYVSKYDDTKEFYTESECIEYDNEQIKLFKFKEFLVDKDLLINYSPENWEHLKWWYLRLYHKRIENILRNEQMWDDIVDETTLKSAILRFIAYDLDNHIHDINKFPIEFYSILFDKNTIFNENKPNIHYFSCLDEISKLPYKILKKRISLSKMDVVLNELNSLDNLSSEIFLYLLEKIHYNEGYNDTGVLRKSFKSLKSSDIVNLNNIIQKFTSKLDNQELEKIFEQIQLKTVKSYLIKQTSNIKTI